MRREERVTVQGPVKERQPDGMSHRGVRCIPLTPAVSISTSLTPTTRSAGASEHGITTDGLFQLQDAPGDVVIVGGSCEALECAGLLRALDCRVTVMVRSGPLRGRGFDREMAERVAAGLAAAGVRMLQPAAPDHVARDPDGRARVAYRSGSDSAAEVCDTVLFATGRRVCTRDLGLDWAGVRATDQGFVVADSMDRTSAGHIFAIGEVAAGRPALAAVAVQAGRLLAQRLLGPEGPAMNYTRAPTAVFTPLEYGCCGYSEEDAVSEFGEAAVEVPSSPSAPHKPVRPSRPCAWPTPGWSRWRLFGVVLLMCRSVLGAAGLLGVLHGGRGCTAGVGAGD